MATLADELLNDFEDSASENEDNAQGFQDGDSAERPSPNGVEEENVAEALPDEKEMEDAEEELAAEDSGAVDMAEDQDDAKAKVEKMRLGGVRDVRSVAGLMKTLQPVLDVSDPPPLYWFCRDLWVYMIIPVIPVLTIRRLSRKSLTTKTFLPPSEQRLWDRSKTTPSTIS